MKKKRYLGLVVAITIILALASAMLFLPSPKYVLVSFDVELVDNYNVLASLMPILERNNVKATFFVTGQFAERNPDIVDYLVKHGNEIACHSYDHSTMTMLSKTDKIAQLQKCKSILLGIISQSGSSAASVGFRAPEHDIDDETFELLDQMNFMYDASLIENLNLPDKSGGFPEIMLSSVLFFPVEDYMFMRNLRIPQMFFAIAKMKKGSHVSLLMHPRYISKYSQDLEKLLGYYSKKGAEFITYSEFLNKRSG